MDLNLLFITSAEDQAFDRAHRLGQERDVHIWKLMVPDTVEERILEASPPPLLLHHTEYPDSFRRRSVLWLKLPSKEGRLAKSRTS